MSDPLASGRRFRMLTLMNDFNGEAGKTSSTARINPGAPVSF